MPPAVPRSGLMAFLIGFSGPPFRTASQISLPATAKKKTMKISLIKKCREK